MLSKSLNDIQKQIDQMKDAVSNTYATAQSALMLAHTHEARISELEREHDENTTPSHEQAPTPRPLPDSNGFWRDTYGDVWVYDGNADNMPILIFDNLHREVYGLEKNSPANWSSLDFYEPFVKIDNPFIQGDNHAN